jgi:hypothetical protein
MKIRSTEDCFAWLNADSPRERLRRFDDEEHDDAVTEFELDNNEVSALIRYGLFAFLVYVPESSIDVTLTLKSQLLSI